MFYCVKLKTKFYYYFFPRCVYAFSILALQIKTFSQTDFVKKFNVLRVRGLVAPESITDDSSRRWALFPEAIKV